MIRKLKLKFGSQRAAGALALDITPITVFVGPNNSGKSKVLTEIEHYCRNTFAHPASVVLDELELEPFPASELEVELSALEKTPKLGETINAGHILVGKVNPQNNQMVRVQLSKQQLINEAQNPHARCSYYSQFLSMFTVRMDGTNRLNLLGEQNGGDLQSTPVNHLAHLFIDNALRKRVRDIVFSAFKKYFVIDPTNIGKLRVRLSDREPVDEREEKGWEEKSVAFHRAAVEVQHASDGVKAFIGIITTILAGDPKIALIDEPEAFLHPALSNKLGKEIAKALRGSRKRLFVATHSSSFLMGCIQSGSPLNIVRLTYNYAEPTARVLPKEKVLELMRNPLLRSTGVLNGLFFESVIVTEADSDRAFYQEINERLLHANDPRGIHSCLFINAQNKQTVWDIVKPLRELGIPALGIVDVDVLKEGGQVWGKPLEGAFIPSASHASMHAQRQSMKALFDATGKDMKRDGGIGLLTGTDREACANLLSQLQEYGCLVVPGGEVESWLKPLGAGGHGSKWLIEMFEKMGDSPESPNYLAPSTGDVWDFLGAARAWLVDPNRKGIPAQ